MQIKVNSIGELVSEKTGKGGYFHFTLKYDKDGKEFSRKLVSFGGSLPAYNSIKDAKAGDKFDVELKKDDTGNWQWLSATPTTGAAVAESKTSGETGKSGNWETTEERARRQVLIVRQSCLAQAIALGDANATDPLKPEQVTATAEKFEAWVMR